MSSENSVVAQNLTKVFSLNSVLEKSRRLMLRMKVGKIRGETVSEHVALDNLTFAVKKGERLGIIGPNGSGKSTLLRIIQHVMQPTSGTITSVGKIGGLIEFNAGFQGNLTAFDNALINLTMQGIGFNRAKELAHDVFRLADLEKFKYVQYKYYSSGMGVRIGFITSLVSKPDIVLLDEVTAVGDAKFRETSKQMIESYIRDRTTIFVSHNMGEVRNICDRVMVLNNGKIDFIGAPADGVKCYQEIQGISLSMVRPRSLTGNTLPADVFVKTIVVRDADNNVSLVSKGERATIDILLGFSKDAETKELGDLEFQLDILRVDSTGLGVPLARVFRTTAWKRGDTQYTVNFATSPLHKGEYVAEVSVRPKQQPSETEIPFCKASFEVHSPQPKPPRAVGPDLKISNVTPVGDTRNPDKIPTSFPTQQEIDPATSSSPQSP